MPEENIKITQDPKILIQQILGKVLDGKEDRVTINIILIGNAGTMVDGKRMEILPQKESLLTRLLGVRKKIAPMSEPRQTLPKNLVRKKTNGRWKYHITKESLEKALESANWNKTKAGELLGIPSHVVIRRCQEWQLKNPKKGGEL